MARSSNCVHIAVSLPKFGPNGVAPSCEDLPDLSGQSGALVRSHLAVVVTASPRCHWQCRLEAIAGDAARAIQVQQLCNANCKSRATFVGGFKVVSKM
ncbi:hypothetical protein PC128_g13041 [Phytophthora cactorum]|nr:hypothetical protein PC128_g13041 [Phytophthora cactorum]KAG4054386.1 hypothetical protein PC123_g10494 [Phytophthora cactorum]